MAVDMFLVLKDIKGETQDDVYKKKDGIDVLAWSWGASQAGTTHMGGGAGSGKVNVQDLSITKYVDKSSATLMKFVCDGKHITKGSLIVRKAGGTALEYIKLELEDIIVTHVSTGGSGGEDRLTENVTLNFRKFKYIYTPQKQDGSGDVAVDMTWDIAAAKDA